MTRTQYLLVQFMEECLEVAHRASKAIRFGLSDVQNGQDLTNAQRVIVECADVYALAEMLVNESALLIEEKQFNDLVEAKKVKVNRYFDYAVARGTVKIPEVRFEDLAPRSTDNG